MNRIMIAFTSILIILSIAFGGYKYVTNLQSHIIQLSEANATYKSNELALNNAINTQSKTIQSLRNDIQLKNIVIDRVTTDFSKARDDVRELEKLLNQDDFNLPADGQTISLQATVNKTYADSIRCLEIAAGSPPTAAELSATTFNQINRQCPTQANPNYRGLK